MVVLCLKFDGKEIPAMTDSGAGSLLMAIGIIENSGSTNELVGKHTTT